jgi:hypothetical protein
MNAIYLVSLLQLVRVRLQLGGLVTIGSYLVATGQICCN